MIQRFLAYAASSSANLAEVFNPAWVVGVFGNITKLISQILGDNLDYKEEVIRMRHMWKS